MDVSRANTEPFYRYHLSREEFDRNLKFAVGALEFIKSNAQTAGSGGTAKTILPTGGEPWGTFTAWNDVFNVSDEAKRFLSHLGVVRAMSAFDDFLISTEAEMNRFCAAVLSNKAPKAAETSDDRESRFETVAEMVGVNVEDSFALQPVLRFFQVARNCVVHRSARASWGLLKE